MVRKNLDLSDAEKAQADKRKAMLGITDRQAYLLGLGLPAPKRKTGRPRKIPLRFLGDSIDDEDKSSEDKIYRP